MIPRPEITPQTGPQMISNGMECGVLVFFSLSPTNDELDKHKEKIFWRR